MADQNANLNVVQSTNQATDISGKGAGVRRGNGPDGANRAQDNNQTDFNKTNTNITTQTPAAGMVSEYTFANKDGQAQASQPNGGDGHH